MLFEKEGEQVAHVKYTVLLMPTGTMQITGVGSCPLATVRSPQPGTLATRLCLTT